MRALPTPGRLRWPLRLAAWALALVVTLALGARGVVAPPDLLLLVVVATGLTSGPRAGAAMGLLAGWSLDLAPPAAAPLGMGALLMAGAGWVSGRAARRGGHPWWWPVPVVATGYLISRSVPVLTDLAAGLPVGWSALGWQLVVTVTLALLVVPLLERTDAALVERGWA